jgi:NitT/TauT family transport system substrate-binding protein
VRQLLTGLVAAIGAVTKDPAAARATVNKQLEELTGKTLKPAVIDRAFANIQVTADPVASQFRQLAKDQVTAGIAEQAPDVAGFADLAPLNDVLAKTGGPAVDAAGLDQR